MFDQQLHGYRQGHQLLSSTIRLPKVDQDLIDRLSDVAGPLAPSERFAPYLTFYPVSSGTHYVVARTWQDFEAPRAGCVRTRSVLLPMADWQDLEDVKAIVDLVTQIGPEKSAERRSLTPSSAPLPTVDPLQGTELIEAMFLEERVPIVVFDAENPEVLALRLTTALWSGFRRGFSMSTFARSPRTIGRRSFDLVFASKESRPRFGDWEGRRIDGRKRVAGRHPWSAPIVKQVLSSPRPSLKELDSLGEMSGDGVGSESALRVSLLWNDLRRKMATSPNAALGMLDIANTRKVRQVEIIRELEPALARSAEMATTTMEPEDAWKYLGALIQKLDGLRPTISVAKAIRTSAVDLSARHPLETIDTLSLLNVEPQRELLISAAADGLSRSLDQAVADRLSRLNGEDLLDLLFASSNLAGGTLGRFPDFSTVLAQALRSVDHEKRIEARRRLLALLIDDFHVEPAKLMIDDLNVEELLKEAAHLASANQFASSKIRAVIADRAHDLNAKPALRDAVSVIDTGAGGKALVEATLQPTALDLDWIFSSQALDQKRRSELLRWMIVRANPSQLRNMLTKPVLLAKTTSSLKAVDSIDAELLFRIASHAALPSREFVALVVELLPHLGDGKGIELAMKAVELALPMEPNEVPLEWLVKLLAVAGRKISGARIFRRGLQRGVSAAAASRNIQALGQTNLPVRKSLLVGIEDMASAIVGRQQMDLPIRATEIAASLLWDSRLVKSSGFVRASAIVLPFALSHRQAAASPLIAAAFPPVYRELAQDNSFDLLSMIFIFLDWDKCKSARRRLIEEFMRSDWRIVDIVTAAVRADDAVRILGQLSKERGGAKALQSLMADSSRIPDEIINPLRTTLKQLRLQR